MTVKVYDAKWQIFRDWADRRKIDPIQATLQIVADFLTFLFAVKKCQVSTIKVYRSTISNTLKYKTGYHFGSHPVLSELIKSFAKQRPVDRSLAPKWDLAFVLSHMCKAPFEPLDNSVGNQRDHLVRNTGYSVYFSSIQGRTFLNISRYT